MDMRYMEFEDESFDCVIDKAALDAILVREISRELKGIVWREFYLKLLQGIK